MWYSKAYRRHLCDMHIDDWDDSFLSEFSPEEYVENLKKAKIQNAMIYFQSHAGLCYYPTKVGHMHKAFIGREDMMRRLVDLCHENGIYVTGYYSINFNTREHDVHPQRRMVAVDGKSMRDGGMVDDGQKLNFASPQLRRYGLCCPNNHEYRQFVYDQIDEMAEYFEFEGLFFDMPFWKHTCYCDKCKERWAKEVGGEIPVEPARDTPEYAILVKKKSEWMGEWTKTIYDYVKKINPEYSVEFNFAQGVEGEVFTGAGGEVSNASDFVGGDLYGGPKNHSLACKFYKNITKNQPFDYMFSRCKPALTMHTLTKTPDEMKLEIMLTAAHHGATMVIDAIDPVGTFDKRVYEQVGKLFDYHSNYEQYFSGDMIEDIGLYYSMRSRYWSAVNKYDSNEACIGLSNILISNHIPFGVTGPYYELEKYKALMMPLVNYSEEEDDERILKYVENGGKLYISGAQNPKLLKKLLGAEVVGQTEEVNIYVSPEKEYEELFFGFNQKYPMPVIRSAPIVKLGDNCKTMAKITLPYTKPSGIEYASIHSDPPGIATDIPAVAYAKYGKGEVIWSCFAIECEQMYEYGKVVMNFLSKLVNLEEMSFTSSASDDVEVTVFKTNDGYTVNTVLVDEKPVARQIEPFYISVKTEKAPKSVVLLPEEKPVEFEYKNGYTIFKTRELNIYDMYKILING